MVDKVRIQPVIKDTERRAGRAPYNFVPLPDAARWLSPEEEPVANIDRYEGLSGEIDIELTALTDFYIRGMWPLHEYEKTPEGKTKEQPAPFMAANDLRLPGSSLRGLFRWMVEILGQSPLDPINDSQLYFRAVGATENLDLRNANSFEPQAKSYKSRIRKAEQARAEGSDVYVRAGYLYPERDNWYIRPASTIQGRHWHQVDHGDRALNRETPWVRVDQNLWFRPWQTSSGIAFADIQQAPTRPGPEWYRGTYVGSGFIPKKHCQWVIHQEDPKAEKVGIPIDDVKAYKEAGVTKAIDKWNFQYHEPKPGEPLRGIPCFYVEWLDFHDERHVSFGHTHYFRLPYKRTVSQAVPDDCRRKEDDAWDLATAIFGRIPGKNIKEGRRGRVFFEDALITPGPKVPYETRARRIVLGSPKPTTYQHYLVQPSESVGKSIHWDGDLSGKDEPVVRGHKAYFHRRGAPLPEGGTDKTSTLFQPAKAGCAFQARIRFENLRGWELGALLSAMELPAECAHRLGMAKPHGLGSFRVKVLALREIDRADRYRALLTEFGDLNLGAKDAMTQREQWKKEFQRKFYGGADLWSTTRIKELRAILRYDGLPTDWLDRTRYLEFGKVPEGYIYNEYQSVGYPRRRELQKRRPLPPASQVVSDAKLPSDPRPRFSLGGRE